MNRIGILVVFLLLLPITLLAETMYVSQNREISLRTGPGMEHKIIAMLKGGTAMTILEKQTDWNHVSLGDGKGGWVLNRYLQSTAPDGDLPTPPAPSPAPAPTSTTPGNTDVQELKRVIETLQADLSKSKAAVSSVTASYDALKQESGTFLALQEKYNQAMAELAAEKDRAAQATQDASGLYTKERLKWFGTGASVLFIGVLLGAILKPQRRHSLLR